MFSDHIRVKLKINSRKVFGKSSESRKLNNTFLNTFWVNEEITQEIRKYFELNNNEITDYQNLTNAGK